MKVTATRRAHWGDAEIGFLIDHADWPSSDVAEALGRTQRSVLSMKSRINRGIAQQSGREEWTDDEVRIVLETPHLTSAQVAAKLPGRTAKSVERKRTRLSRELGVNFGGRNKDPGKVGARPLIAKTCRTCGRLLDASWFPFNHGKRNWWSECRKCISERKSRAPQRDRTGRDRGALDRLTLPTADHRGEEWTGGDLEILSDPDLTILEKALKLGRTYSATSTRLHLLGLPSKRHTLEPDKEVWRIDAPHAEDLAWEASARA